MSKAEHLESKAPSVPLWQTWGLRLIFTAMAIILGIKQWTYILEGTAEWSSWRGLGHSMLATLALLAIAGVFHPLKFLPLMLYEMAWKSVWLLVIALPAWMDGRPVPAIVNVPASSIGIVILMILVPWRYVWWCYVSQPIERWRPGHARSAVPKN